MTWLDDIRDGTNERLAEFFVRKQHAVQALSPESVELVDVLAEFTMRGGKRLRPALTYAGLCAVSRSATVDRMLDVGASLELLQTYLLVHDDWMDDDAQRRGGPTAHVTFAKRYGKERGAAVAILAGDLACSWAWELMIDAAWPNGDARRCGLETYASIQHEVVLGQHLDVVGRGSVSLVHHLKTGSYTVRGPLLLGAILGDGSDEVRKVLDLFGNPAGVAFQLRDDLLGTFGDTKKTGKPVASDLRSGKRTALIEAVESELTNAERELLASAQRPEATDDDVLRARDVLEARGARARVEARLADSIAEASAALDTPLLEERGRKQLSELLELLTMRNH